MFKHTYVYICNRALERGFLPTPCHGEAAYVSHYVRGTLRQAQVLALPVASL